MDLGLTGRTAAVAGGSSGLGFATAQALANDGVRVVLCGRDAKRDDHLIVREGLADQQQDMPVGVIMAALV